MTTHDFTTKQDSQKLYDDILVKYTELKQYIWNLPKSVEAKKLEEFYFGQIAEHVALQHEGTQLADVMKMVSADYHHAVKADEREPSASMYM